MINIPYDTFNPNILTKFIIHGFRSTGRDREFIEMKDVLLKKYVCNVISKFLEKYPQNSRI